MWWFNERVHTVVLVLLVGAAPWLLCGVAQARPKPLTKAETLQLLKGDVPPARIAEIARQQGIDFPMTPENESELKQAGATEELLRALREITPKIPAAAVLEILTIPGGAQVYVDDALVARTSAEGHLRIATLAPGKHRLRLSAESYDDYEANVSLVAGETAIVTAPLAPHAATILAIQSTPGQSQVYVDDAFSGQTSERGTLNVPNLTPGSHRVRLTHEGYHDDEHQVQLVAGHSAQVVAVLAKIETPASPAVSSPSAPPATQTFEVLFKTGGMHYSGGMLTIANGTMSYRSDNGKQTFSFALTDVNQAFETLGDLRTRHDLHIVLKNGQQYQFLLADSAGHGVQGAQFVAQMIALINQAQGRK